ncbi:Peptidase family M50 [uncultured archaeon]|nr:Peptidase family M50 [uncultured archaeon]
MSNAGRISKAEMKDLFLSLMALVIAFSMLGERRLPGVEVLVISAVGVGSGFLLHELAHKFVAQRFGYFAEYRANRMGLVLIVLMAFAGFIFAAPGAVMIRKASVPQDFYLQDPIGQEELKSQARWEELCISLAGPMTNILLAVIFFLLLASGAGLWAGAANFALFINLTLAAFNLLPFGPLDGKKIIDSNRLVWAVVAVPTILAALPVYLGMV